MSQLKFINCGKYKVIFQKYFYIETIFKKWENIYGYQKELQKLSVYKFNLYFNNIITK